MRLVITKTDLPPASTILLEGELDLATAERLELAVRQSVADDCLQVSLDLSGVTFMDCSGLHALSACRRLLRTAGGRLRIVALSASVERILVPSDLRRALTVSGLAAS
jgi:anti-anti-sigma factor